MATINRNHPALVSLVRVMMQTAASEEERWAILESLCVATGLLHGRTPQETGLLVAIMGTRIANHDRQAEQIGGAK